MICIKFCDFTLKFILFFFLILKYLVPGRWDAKVRSDTPRRVAPGLAGAGRGGAGRRRTGVLLGLVLNRSAQVLLCNSPCVG